MTGSAAAARTRDSKEKQVAIGEPTRTTLTEDQATQRDAFVGRLFGAFLASADLLTVYIGDTLGLYRSLADEGPATSAELAARTGIAERYAREWLEQQAVTGILVMNDTSKAPDQRAYTLPVAHAEPLLDRDSLNSIVPLARLLPPAAAVMPRLLEAYRSGGGVSWADYGDDLWQSQGDFNRPLFRHQLTQEFLPQIADVHAKLGQGARVADVACGVGWSSIAIAKGYPMTSVDGFDLDDRAIATARRAAAEAGVADRVNFHVRDAADPEHKGRYDLVTIFEAVHDLSRPVETLRAAREMLVAGGTVLVMDERVAESFTAPGDDVERLMYGASILICLPNGLAEQPSAATGTVMRPDTLRRYAMAAGFRDVEVLGIEHPFFRFYRLWQ